jgi:L-glyceraldehyde 3-phosphate reductase
LTDRYLNGIPDDSRASRNHFLKKSSITEEVLSKVRKLNDVAKSRNQTLAQLALSWILRKDRVTSVIIGASSAKQIADNVKIVENLEFSDDELFKIEEILCNKRL